MAGKAFAYSLDCQSRIIANCSFKASGDDACSLRCIFASFLAVPALAIHTMKARGDDDDDEDSDDSNNSNDKVWDEDDEQ